MIRVLCIPLLLTLSQFGFSSPLLDYVEQPITMKNLISLGQQSVSFRACDRCETQVVQLSSDVAFMEAALPITKKRALELAISRDYNTISVFYSRSTNTTNLVRFGSIEGPAESVGNDSLSAQETLQ